MEGVVKGDVVVLPYPFSDLTQTKRRPALVVAVRPGDDVILAQITSQAVTDADAIPLAARDFADGKLSQPSNIRPGRLFTADRSIILYRAGKVSRAKLDEVIDGIVALLRA